MISDDGSLIVGKAEETITENKGRKTSVAKVAMMQEGG